LRRDHMLALTEGDRIAGLLAPTAEAPPAGKGLIVVADALARSQLAGAIDEMRVVAELAESRGARGRIDPADFALELLLLAAPHHGAAIAHRVVEPLRTAEAGRSTELLSTLDEFLACGLDRRRTAEHLHVHPNTLDYRLKRIRELTDLDLRNPQHVALVVLALKSSVLPGR
jgi:DNA-binding PucR family transcriptional regulator